MSLSRRSFIAAGTAGAAIPTSRASLPESRSNGIALVAFDGFPLIDARPVARRAEDLFPGQGDALMNAWRTRQFEYCWLRTLSHRYRDFWHTTQDALVFAARQLHLSLPDATRIALMRSWLELGTWPDARPALERLRAADVRAVFLSNFTAPMLDAAVRNGQLGGLLEPHLSTDRVGAFKPDPRAYSMALQAFGVRRESVVFCAGAGWDAAGAHAFGYRTFWLNRNAQPDEELGVTADASGASLDDLVRFVLEPKRGAS